MDYSPPGSSVHGISQARILGYHFLLLETFPTQGSNLCLLCWQSDSLPLSHQRNRLIISFKIQPPFFALGVGVGAALHLFRAGPVSQWVLRTHIDGVPALHSKPTAKISQEARTWEGIAHCCEAWTVSRTFSFLGSCLSSASIQSPLSPEKNRRKPRKANLPKPILWVEAFCLHLPSLCLPPLHFWCWLNHKLLRL